MAFRKSKTTSKRIGFMMDPGPKQLAREVGALSDAIMDLRPEWPSTIKEIRRSVAEAHASKGSSIGADWPPYSAGYAKRVGTSSPTLSRSGKLLRAATASNAGKLLKPLGMTYRVKVPYVRVHEWGSSKRGIAKRSFIQVSDGAERTIFAGITSHTNKMISIFERGRGVGALKRR